MGRRRYRRAHQRRTLAIIYVVFLLVCLVCLGVFVAAVAVNALSLERPDSWGYRSCRRTRGRPRGPVALDAGFGRVRDRGIPARRRPSGGRRASLRAELLARRGFGFE